MKQFDQVKYDAYKRTDRFFYRNKALCVIACIAAVVCGVKQFIDLYTLLQAGEQAKVVVALYMVRLFIHILTAGVLAIPAFRQICLKQMSFVPIVIGVSELLHAAATYINAELNDVDISLLITGSMVIFVLLPAIALGFSAAFIGYFSRSKPLAFLPIAAFFALELFLGYESKSFFFFTEEAIKTVLLVATVYLSIGCTSDMSAEDSINDTAIYFQP